MSRYTWEIEPHPDTSDFDVLVTNSDDEALEKLLLAAEQAWDTIEDGETKTIKIRRNTPATADTTEVPRDGS